LEDRLPRQPLCGVIRWKKQLPNGKAQGLQTVEAINPFLRWAGSKRRLLPKLAAYWSGDRERYVEPFVGSAALFFAIRPSRALLTDINPDLIETFAQIRDEPAKVHKRLVRLPLGRESYYILRAKDPASLKPADRAARFIFLNRFCFNGLYRTNMRGAFNVPYSPAKTGNLPSWQHLLACSRLLANVDLRPGDFEKTVLENVKAKDFVYLDPPYAVQNRRVFRQYGPDTFGISDLKRLSAVLDEIHSRGAHFVLSYAWCREANQAFKNWPTRRVYTQRNIAGFVRHRRRAAELIVSNVPR
jgi:DNA adenine methylase